MNLSLASTLPPAIDWEEPQAPSAWRPASSRLLLALLVLAGHAGILLALRQAPPATPAAPTVMIAVLPPPTVAAPQPPQPTPPRPPAPQRHVAKAVSTPAPVALSKHPSVASAAPSEPAPPVTTEEAPPPPAPAPPAPSPTSTKHPPTSDTAASYHAAYLHNPQPPYPLLSRKRREEGRVRLRVRVAASGRPESVNIVASSGFARLDQAALDAVGEWQFVPARQQGLAVAGWVEVPIQFNLEKQDE